MNTARLTEFVESRWDSSILEALEAYIRIPAKSPLFDPDWQRAGHIDAAIELMATWCQAQEIPGMQVEVRRLPGRTPLLLVDIPGSAPGTVLLYGHLDKQPEFTGWADGLAAWGPVLRDDKLYGRGGADDGYAVFASIAAIAAVQDQMARHARCVVLIEASEESGSIDLSAYLETLESELRDLSLVVCLDAEAGDYERLWCTTSLRGLVTGQLSVKVLEEGVHSGMATGIAPTPFRIAEQLLARIEDPASGELLLDALKAQIPCDRHEQILAAAEVLGRNVAAKLPWTGHTKPVASDPVELIVKNTWRGSLAVTGADGLPPTACAGNVLLPDVTLRLSMRLPPTASAERAASAMKAVIESAPPYDADVRCDVLQANDGWNAPGLSPWLETSLAATSKAVYGHGAVYAGCGGTIPFMATLGQRFPDAQFLVTGVLGPQSNAHGPNEFLHLRYARQLTACLALVLCDHGNLAQSS